MDQVRPETRDNPGQINDVFGDRGDCQGQNKLSLDTMASVYNPSPWVPKKEDGEFEVNLATHKDPVSKPNTSGISCARCSENSEAWRLWRNDSHRRLSNMT